MMLPLFGVVMMTLVMFGVWDVGFCAFSLWGLGCQFTAESLAPQAEA